MPDASHEARLAARHGGGPVIGLDEVGRGPLAGPVVAAAVWLDFARLPAALLAGIDDSKRLPPARRQALATALATTPGCRWALGAAGRREIDRLNILGASLLAMARAAEALTPLLPAPPAAALVDGNRLPPLACPAETLIGGDGLSLSIAAASILAKTRRDAFMALLARRHPGYGWERNQGYPTAEHRAALLRLGPSPQHRRSFRPVSEALTLSR